MGKINNKLKAYVRNWLNVRESMNEQSITIEKPFNDRLKSFEYELWYEGDANSLHQFYTNTSDYIGNTAFWKAPVNVANPFRKLHSDLPSLIIDKLIDITIDDMNEVEFKEKGLNEIEWKELALEMDFKKLLKEAVSKTLVTGQGAFKISFDPDISSNPIVEFYGATDVSFDIVKRKVVAVRFYSTHILDNKEYRLEEHYTHEGIIYTLYDSVGNDVTIPLIENIIGINSRLFESNMMLAVPFVIFPNKKTSGKGRSIFEGKLQTFDAFDEVFSTFMDEIREGRTKTYIPEMLIPRNPHTGELVVPNAFNNRFVKIENAVGENKENKIETISSRANIAAVDSAFLRILDLCVQGIISPSTLGIDVKKLDNAESQREKEKTTLYTRNNIIRALEELIPQLIQCVLQARDFINDSNCLVKKYEVTASFGEYGAPDFNSLLDTIGKAVSNNIMSINKAVDELYGDSMTSEEKAEEVARLTQAEPSVVTEDMYGSV